LGVTCQMKPKAVIWLSVPVDFLSSLVIPRSTEQIGGQAHPVYPDTKVSHKAFHCGLSFSMRLIFLLLAKSKLKKFSYSWIARSSRVMTAVYILLCFGHNFKIKRRLLRSRYYLLVTCHYLLSLSIQPGLSLETGIVAQHTVIFI